MNSKMESIITEKIVYTIQAEYAVRNVLGVKSSNWDVFNTSQLKQGCLQELHVRSFVDSVRCHEDNNLCTV